MNNLKSPCASSCSCDLKTSGLSIWGKEFRSYLYNGGKLKCDECRTETWWSNHDAPTYLCRICKKGLCTTCGVKHFCKDANSHSESKSEGESNKDAGETSKCSSEKCQRFPSGLAIWGSQFHHHLQSGGTIKCDVCRVGTWWINHDGPTYICTICNKGLCISCSKIHC